MLFFEQNQYKVCAIIAAGGSSNRMGFDKLMTELSGETVIVRSVEAFERCGFIDEIVVVTRKELVNELNEMLLPKKFSKLKRVTSGGETRQRSVYKGVAACSDDIDILCIHDGARPLVSEKVIADSLVAGARYKAATAAVKVKDTIKKGENGLITETLDRDHLYQIQTPQTFLKQLYLDAYQAADKEYSDDCQLIEALGIKVALSQGSYSNIKLTTREDFAVAAALLKQMEETK